MREKEVRLGLAPSVANPKIDRTCTLKQLRYSGLVEACEHGDGAGIKPKRLKPPFLCFEIAERDTAVILEDGRADSSNSFLTLAKCALCKRYDALLMRLSAGPSLARKTEKRLRSNEPSARLVLK